MKTLDEQLYGKVGAKWYIDVLLAHDIQKKITNYLLKNWNTWYNSRIINNDDKYANCDGMVLDSILEEFGE